MVTGRWEQSVSGCHEAVTGVSKTQSASTGSMVWGEGSVLLLILLLLVLVWCELSLLKGCFCVNKRESCATRDDSLHTYIGMLSCSTDSVKSVTRCKAHGELSLGSYLGMVVRVMRREQWT